MSDDLVKEVYEKYDGFIRGSIRKYSSLRGEEEEMRSLIWYRIVTKKYLESYDPTKIRSMYDYLFQVVRSICVNRIREKKTRPIDMSLKVSDMGLEDEDSFLEVLFGSVDSPEEDISYKMLVESVEEALLRIPSFGSNMVLEEQNGVKVPVVYERSLVEVFRLKYKGLSQDEIAEKLNVTPGSVSGYVKRLKEVVYAYMEKLGYTIPKRRASNKEVSCSTLLEAIA